MKGVLAAGFIEGRQDVLLKIEGRFAALNEGAVDAESPYVDAF
jgi:hypothetical protein